MFSLAGLVGCVALCVFDKSTTLLLLIPVTLIAVAVDFGRAKHPVLLHVFNTTFSSIMRADELIRGKRLGSTYFLPACCITILLFSKPVAIAAVSVLVISDTAAALIGKRYGRKRILGGKSAEGTLAFVVSAALVIVVVGIFNQQTAGFFVAGFVASIVAAFVELFTKKIGIDDNFTIPLSTGAVMTLLMFF